MDGATLTGLLISLGLIGYAMFLGGNLAAFLDIPAMLIVILGTVFVTMISFNLSDMGRTLLVVVKAFTNNLPDAGAEAARLIKLAQKARQSNLLAIQRDVAGESETFLRQGLVLAVDGATPIVLENILKTDTASMLERHAGGITVLRRAAEIAPAMGLISTLIGLVQMLGNLSNPDTIGPGMAVAILGTFYGAVMAYMVFTPLAGKLERRSAEELLLRKIYTSGILSILKQENPRQLQLTLNAVLPPAQRIFVFR